MKSEKTSRGPWMKVGVRQPPVRAFMDDMSVSTMNIIQTKWTLKEIEGIVGKIKLIKSRSLVFKKRKVTGEKFRVGEGIIPS